MSRIPEWLGELIRLILRFLLDRWEPIRALMAGVEASLSMGVA